MRSLVGFLGPIVVRLPIGNNLHMLQSLHRVCLFLIIAVTVSSPISAVAQGNAKNGEYLAKAAGCVGCHTNNKPGSTPYSGGRALDTPFGTFYGPNITPDKLHGLGAWTEADFKRAVRQGERRDGSHYFPAFPYPSFTGMTDQDIQDLWAFLKTIPANGQANVPHRLRFPFGWRFLVTGWKLFFFTPGPFPATVPADAMAGRGAYLVSVLGHCGECHTPRNFLGGPNRSEQYAGAKIPEGKVPNLTPTRLKKWSDSELKEYLMTGNAPNGDVAVEPMSEVITNTTSQLSGPDMAAVIAYLRLLPAREEQK